MRKRCLTSLKQWLPGISSLRDISLTDFKKYEDELPALTTKEVSGM